MLRYGEFDPQLVKDVIYYVDDLLNKAQPVEEKFHYIDDFMNDCETTSSQCPDVRPREFYINGRSAKLYLCNNPWTYYQSSVCDRDRISSVFQYCICCGEKRFSNQDFEKLRWLDHRESVMDCQKKDCHDKTLILQELINGRNNRCHDLFWAILHKDVPFLKQSNSMWQKYGSSAQNLFNNKL